jgi:hypothetical protein
MRGGPLHSTSRRGSPAPTEGRRRHLAGFIALAWLMALLCSATAHAAPNGSVEIVIAAGDEVAATRLAEALRDPARRVGVDARISRAPQVDPRQIIEPQPGAPAMLARVWIDLERAQRATLYLVDGSWERILVRHVALQAGLDEVAREELGLILRAALEGLLAGERIGIGREEARKTLAPRTPPARAAEPEPPPDPGPVFELGLLYEAQLFSSQHAVTHGPLAAVGLRGGDGDVAVGGALSGQLRLPLSVDGERAGLELGTWALRALVTVRIPVATRLSLRGGLGGGADIVDIEPRVRQGTGARTAEARYEAAAVARAQAGAEWILFGGTSLSAAVACEMDVVAQRYVDVHAGKNDPVLSPFRVRPGLLLGITTAATLAGTPGRALR